MKYLHRKWLSRRSFLKLAGCVLPFSSLSGEVIHVGTRRGAVTAGGFSPKSSSSFTIADVNATFEIEPLKKPFGFKGAYMTKKWQTVALLKSAGGEQSVGHCSQSVLWADASVFAAHAEDAGNALMFAMLDYALQQVKGKSFMDPISMLEYLFPVTYDYGVKITENEQLDGTFALMSLVPLDNAAWLLYARNNGLDSYDAMIPKKFSKLLSYRHSKIAMVPLISYGVPIRTVKQLVQEGHFFLKIKIGQPGTQKEMLTKDQERLSAIHKAVGDVATPYTKNGRIQYYLDANGRYEEKESLLQLLGHLEKIGASDQVYMVEEPFPFDAEYDLSDLGTRFVADESAHSGSAVQRRIEMGYDTIAIKGAAKTLSMSLKILDVANQYNVSCFCADSTASPLLVDWNKNLAARLAPLPGIDTGLLEMNGHQNYANWEQMKSYHPANGASWTKVQDGMFNLGEGFYAESGGVLKESDHYKDLFYHS